jgi:DNA-binding response OmpR family regulator
VAVTANILIVSTDTEIQYLLKEVLCDYEVRVLSSSHSPGVLFQFYFVQPDLVILDMHPPSNQGRKILRCLRERSAVPIVALIDPDHYEMKMLCLNGGADDVLEVCCAELELRARVRALLRRTRVRRVAGWPAAMSAAEGR